MAVVEVLISVPFGEEFVERLRAVDARLRVQVAPPQLRRWLRNELPDDPEQRAVAEQQAAEYLDTAEVLVGWPRLPKGALARAGKLRWVQSLSAGVERIDAADFQDRVLTNASGVAAVAMAEYTIGMMLMFAKGFPHMMRRQRERVWDRRFEARELSGKTCGVVGMGAIGGETARRAAALGMRVLAIRRSVTARESFDPLFLPPPIPTPASSPTSNLEPQPSNLGHELLPPAELHDLLRASDYVVLAAPLTPETRHMIGRDELAQMRRSAVLINVGRGALVDEGALIDALRDGVIAGAGLDVFEQEPLPAESPLWEMDNVVVTPHFSAGSDRYAERAADIVCENLRRYLSGEPLVNIVDPRRGY